MALLRPGAASGLMALLVLGVGCESRDRGNPFDPENPRTGGTPPAIEALAGDGRIDLSWDLSGLEDVGTVSLVRSDPSAPPAVLLAGVALSGSHVDETVSNGTTYAYHLALSTPDGDQLESSRELATPGAAVVWFGDAAGNGLARVAPDGRDLLFRVGFGRAFLDLSVDLSGGIWAADYFNGQIVQLDPNGEPIRFLDAQGANVVAFEAATAQVWVGSYLERTLKRYASTDGRQTLNLPEIGLPEDIEVEPFPGAGVWVATQDNGVIRVDNDQVIRSWGSFEWPVALSRDATGWLWVVDRRAGTVSRLRVSTGEILESEAVLRDPRDCTQDGDGGVYVADPERGGVVRVDADGREVGFWDLPGASGVTRDPRTGLLWVVQRDAGQISVYDAEGVEHSRLTVGGSPVRIEGLWR